MGRIYSLSRPVPQIGHIYRNGAGQVRRLLEVNGKTAKYQVVRQGDHIGPQGWFSSQHQIGSIRNMLWKSFCTWMVAECDMDGREIANPELRPRKARPNQQAFREALTEAMEKIYEPE